MSLRTEAVLAGIAAGQWGLFTATQAQQEGITRVQLTRLVQAGVVERRSHGVYLMRGAGDDYLTELRVAWLSLDPARSPFGRLADALAGPVVSHASAANLYRLGDLDADRHEFTLPGRKQTRRTDVVLHRRSLCQADVTIRDGLPVTRPARTVVDLLAAGHDGEHVAGVLGSAVRDRSIDIYALAAEIGPFAAKYGCPSGDGDGLLDLLLRLGGAFEYALADLMAEKLRAADIAADRAITQIDIGYVTDQVIVVLDPSAHHKESISGRERSGSSAR